MRSYKIRTYLVFFISAVTLLLAGAITSLYTRQFKEYTVGNLIEYGVTISHNISVAVIDLILTEDFAPLLELIGEFSAMPNIISIEISNAKWDILAATDMNMVGASLKHQHKGVCLLQEQHQCIYFDKATGRMFINSEIILGEMLMGYSTVTLSLAEMTTQLGLIYKRGAFTALACWLLAISLGLMLSRMLTRPVHAFMQATESISKGNFGMSLPSPRGVHELAKFSEALTVMTRAIVAREEALQQSEKKYRQLFLRAMEGVFVCDSKGGFQDVNPALVAILGYAGREDLLGRNLFTDIFASPESTEIFGQLIGRHVQIKNHEVRMVRKDSDHIIVALSCQTVKDEAGGTELRIEGLLRDITRQKQAEEEIARMRNYLNNIIESMPSILITVNQASEVTQWNSAAHAATGILPQDAMGRKIWDIAPDFMKYQQQIQYSKTSREPVRLHREHLEHLPVQIYNLTIFPLIANGAEGVTIRLDDITELEMKEKQLRQAQKMESVGTLAGGLAHDFNNVLGGILGNLSLIEFRLDKHEIISEPELREYVKRMNSAGLRAADMVRHLLTLSRKQEMDMVPVDLNQAVKHIRKISENTFDKSIRIVIRPAAIPACVMADPTQIEQVILNICINASHAMTIMRGKEVWGGTLTMELARINADNLFCKTHPEALEGFYWQLSISDTGVGMDAETVSRIFDPFFTTKDTGKGTGLGLAMTYNIVKQLGGFIDVYSEEGSGTVFRVYLPLLERDGAVLREEKKVHIHHGSGTILVVDDNDILRETSRAILESAGYTVITANDGRQGIDLYQHHQQSIKAVVLDMVMPVMSGREAFYQLRKINPTVRILLVSGLRQDNRVEELIQLGVNAFVQKPYTVESLTRTLHEILQ